MANTWDDIGIGTLWSAAIDHDEIAVNILSELIILYGLDMVNIVDDTDFTITFHASVGDSDLVADFTSLVGATDPALTITQVYMGNQLFGINAGTKTCDSIITCNLTAASTGGFRITQVESSEYLDLDRSLSNLDEIIFNTQTRMVTVNSSDAREDIDFDSTWFKIPVGTFNILPDTTAVTMEVAYRQRWV